MDFFLVLTASIVIIDDLKCKNRFLTCHYKLSFSCDSKDVLNVLIFNNCDFFYIGQSEKLRKTN